MRVLYWSELFWPYVGGSEVFATKLLPALRDRGYAIAVVTSHDYLDLPDRSQLDGIPIHRIPMRASLRSGDVEEFAAALQQIKDLKRAFAPHLVHISGVGPSAVFHLKTESQLRIPLVVSMRTEVLTSQKLQHSSILAQLLRRADWVTTVSSAVLRQARQLVPEIANRSSVVYNFIDVPDLAPTSLPFEQPKVLCLGRLVHVKGFDLALKALALTLKKHPRVRLVIAGNGPEKPSLQCLADSLGVRQAVEFIGPVAPKDVPDLINRATFVALPSRREGLPMVSVEAGMMARPVVAANIGGISEVVVDGQTGLLVPKEDAAALAQAFDRLLSQSETASEFGLRARDHVQHVFAREDCVHDYSQIYERLCQFTPSFCSSGK
jgi:glycogen(starch) synthase